jgi:hypothetical protein
MPKFILISIVRIVRWKTGFPENLNSFQIANLSKTRAQLNLRNVWPQRLKDGVVQNHQANVLFACEINRLRQVQQCSLPIS